MMFGKYVYLKSLFQPNVGRFWLIDERDKDDYYDAYAHACADKHYPHPSAGLSSKRYPIIMDYSAAAKLGMEAGKKEWELIQLLKGKTHD